MSELGPAVRQIEEASEPRSWMGRALEAIHSHPWVSRAVLLAYAAAVTFPHAEVQWAVNEVAIRIGHPRLYRLSAAIVLAEGAMLTALLLRAARGRTQQRLAPGLWFLSLGLIVGAWAGLTANNVELVHYPQYFPEGMVLAALTLSPAEAMAWVALLGGLDEAYQYWCLPRSRVSLYDFNDITMDVLGGAAGVAFAVAYLRCERLAQARRWSEYARRPGIAALLAAIGSGVALWALGLVAVVREPGKARYWFALGDFRAPSFWAHVVENGPKHYHTLTPIEGAAVIVGTIAAYAGFTRKYRFQAD